jgi:hypothetical protein
MCTWTVFALLAIWNFEFVKIEFHLFKDTYYDTIKEKVIEAKTEKPHKAFSFLVFTTNSKHLPVLPSLSTKTLTFSHEKVFTIQNPRGIQIL